MARLMEVFSDESDPMQPARVREAWEFVNGFPLPKFNMCCTVCHSSDVKVMAFTFHPKDPIHMTQPTSPYRCITEYKCRACTAAHTHSMAVPEEMFHLRSEDGQPRVYSWVKALEIIREESRVDGVAASTAG